MRPPFAPAPPFGFNFFFPSAGPSFQASEFRAKSQSGFQWLLTVMPQVAWFTTIVALSEKSFALISCHRHSDMVRLILLHIIILSPTLDF